VPDRIIVIVLDSFGIGPAPDAHRYGDESANTLGSIAKALPSWTLPQLSRLGLFSIPGVSMRPPDACPAGAYARLIPVSAGKDTTTGHFELAGLRLERPFPTYPNGFPVSLLQKFEGLIGTRTLGGMPASGTEIIQTLGAEHLRTGYPIVYTSADSVFQIACHSRVCDIRQLYEYCQIARDMLIGEHAVARVIARPFDGEPGKFYRTSQRRDFSVKPPGKTVLQAVVRQGMEVAAVGKIEDIYAGTGITQAVHVSGNDACMEATLALMGQDFSGLIMTNLTDFDTLYGHRRDIPGYARALSDFDRQVPALLRALKQDDILILTADHGCDPGYQGTDHTRENVPLLLVGQSVRPGVNRGTIRGFDAVAATVADALQLDYSCAGHSLWPDIRKP
jgi:phosphopentomutase